MNKNALIVFLKNPIKGKVKTRLAKDIGEEAALEIYLQLVEITRKALVDVPCDKFIYYSDFIDNADNWSKAEKQVQLQSDNLGERIIEAINTTLNKGYQSVAIIGTDCPKIDAEDINSAFALLYNKDVDIVLGPSKDGGFYLLAVSSVLNPSVFKNVVWSSSSVLNTIVNNGKEFNMNCLLIEEKIDIDFLDDLLIMNNLFKIELKKKGV